LNRAKGKVNAKKYAWESVEEAIAKTKELGTKAALAVELNEYAPKGELVIVKDFTKDGVAEMHLAYKFNIYAFEPISREWVYVDAQDGKILLVDKIIKHVDEPQQQLASVTTPVKTRYSGIKDIRTKQISGNDPNSGKLLTASNPTESYVPGALTYALVDDTRGTGVETYDLNGVGGLPLSLAPAYSMAKSFTDVDNNWTLAEHVRGGAVESENDDFAWDAHWGAGVVYDYWKVKHNRLSFDGKDAKIKSYIHSGIGYDNAFWNGKVMTYGDGSYPAKANGFKPLTSLDVCGHEIGHGVCEFTADLVYARESGAMNEGFSDIWAACVEYFAIKTIDAGLATQYKPFHIGEQISANPARPLRRMDHPQAEGDPDTYGGTFWKDPNCTPPTLVNDQCGVHTNSGLLNKWFYLITVGSGAGSGPDAAYAGFDDGSNDKGNAYSVDGLGFDISEKITYLTELMLTSTATFAEARNVSISVALALTGNPCSNIGGSVTNAWYAVGVGEAAPNPCKISYGFIYQPGSFVSEGQLSSGCNLEAPVYLPVLLPPNSTATITVSGTATNGTDYTLTKTAFSNATNTFKSDSVVIFIKDDGVAEGNETIVLNMAVTNVGTNALNNKYTLTIVEDDVAPVIGNGSKTLLNETFTQADGFTDPAGWTEKLEIPEALNGDPVANGKNQWGVFFNKLSITGKEGTTGVQYPGSTYNNASQSRTIIGSSLIDARGLSILQLKFDFAVQGEIDPAGTDPSQFPAFDYMAIVYSFDGVTWYELAQPPYARFASAEPELGTFDYPLPLFLSNKFFYLGFRWYNDTNAGGPLSVTIDNLTLIGSDRKIENDLNHNARENLAPGQEVYFYSMQDGEILGGVKNSSTKDFGCTNLYVEKTGTGSFNLYQGRDGLHKVSDKIIRVETGLIYKAPTSVTLYYTEAQLQALELATAKDRGTFSVYHVSGPSYTSASSLNTKRYTALFTPIPGVGGYYTISYNEKANGSYALGTPVSLPGLQAAITRSTMELAPDVWKFGTIYPNPAKSESMIQVSAPQSQKIKLEVVNSIGQLLFVQDETINPGKSQIRLRVGKLTAGSYLLRIKNDMGKVMNSQAFIKE
jgi:Zn-dependent metalloprotease